MTAYFASRHIFYRLHFKMSFISKLIFYKYLL